MYSSQDGPWKDAPSDGVLFVLCKKGDVVQTISGSDHYILLDDETVAETEDLGPLLRAWGVKFGRWTTHKNMERIGKRVAEEAAKWPR
jgi:hypothetical protein